MRVNSLRTFWYEIFRGFDGTQYAMGSYAVRKNHVIYRTLTTKFTFKMYNFHQEVH